MHQNDEVQTREPLIEIEHITAALQHEKQWLERLQRAAQDYLDRPNAVTRGKLKRVLDVIQRRAGR